MRIIAGTKKKLKLFEPTTDQIRPTTDRAKESLFNLIGPKINDAIFFDIFTGTGAIALEAKSRNAKKVYAVDNSTESKRLIAQNIEKSKLEINFFLQKASTFLEAVDIQADIIFMDAPFDNKNEKMFTLIDYIVKEKKINDNGLVILERKTSNDNNVFLERYPNGEIRSYGKVSFIILGER